MKLIMRYATKWQINSAQWQAKRRLGLVMNVVNYALKAQVKIIQHNQINLGFQPVTSISVINPRLRCACHWAKLTWAFSPRNKY